MPTSRPFRQRVSAAGPNLTSRDLTPNAGGRHRGRYVRRAALAELWCALGRYGPGRPATFSAGRPRRGGNAGHLEMAGSLISRGLLDVNFKSPAGNMRSPSKQPFTDFQSHFHEDERCEHLKRALRRNCVALRPASLSLRRRYCRARLPGLLKLVLQIGQSSASARSRSTPEMRWHSESSSSWVLTSLAIGFGARGR